MNKVFFLFGACVLISGCSTLSKSECESKEWYHEGYSAGLMAEDAREKFQFYKKNCGDEHGIQPDLSRFEAGLKAGNLALCTTDGGYNLGKNGGTYRENCPKEKEDEFFKGYQRGQSIYTSNKLQSLENQIGQLQGQISQKDAEISRLQSELSSKTCP